ncbi:MAG: AraC family transcriptional regulator ligand-binding domain-containing protein [Oceanospirillaceae bacterium]|nr:AraC family transcriptional regulator ligand-binding domain-containing protein [Oceanospirillaceae bacterium]
MYRVRSGGIEGFLGLARQLGANPVELIESAGLSLAQFRNPDTYIPYPRLAELLELAARRCQSPLFGLQLAERQSADVLGTLMLSTAGAATVGEGLSSAANYLYLHASDVHLEPRLRDDQVHLAVTFGFSCPLGTDQLMLLSVAHLATLAAYLLQEDRYGLSLHFRQATPADTDALQSTRFRRLKFNQAFDGIRLRAQQLELPNFRDDSLMREHIREYMRQLKSRYPDSLEDQAKEIIGHLLPTGDCRIEQVAATLGIHTRTLQARLRDQGKNYRDILQSTRLELARHHLSQASVNITELALQLGYAEVAVFSRHFKRWSGLSPREWRKKHGKAAGH